MRILKIFSPLFSFQRVVSPQKWDPFFHFQPTLLFNFDPCSMAVIFLGTNSKFCQKAKQVIENRPVFTEWEQNIILLGQKMLLLFSCFQDHFVTNLIWKRKRKQTKMKKQLWESHGSLSSVHLCLQQQCLMTILAGLLKKRTVFTVLRTTCSRSNLSVS